MQRLTDDQVVRLARVEPWADQVSPLPHQFMRQNDAWLSIAMRAPTSWVRWPDGSAGYMVRGAGEDQSQRLVETYRIARALLEDQLLASSAATAVH